MSIQTRLLQPFLVLFLLALSACAPSQPAVNTAGETTQAPAELRGIQTYVVSQSEGLHSQILRLQAASDRYYALAKAAGFDYARLWKEQPKQVLDVLGEARAAFLAANPEYEQMEGVVAGVPSLSKYDLILDAGTPGSDGGEDVAPVDLALPDGRTLAKPGNLFEVTEAALWGTDPAYSVDGIHPDFNGDGEVSLGDSLPDANILKGAADAFVGYTAELAADAKTWQPTQAEAFGALVANVPTFTDFMEGWKNSRFVLGSASAERGFVATSRLSDLRDNITSWQKIYAGLSPAVRAAAPDQDAQITRDLDSLHQYVSKLYEQESQQGKQFTPEEVDVLNAEGQNRAMAIAGQITQAAAQLGIQLEVE